MKAKDDSFVAFIIIGAAAGIVTFGVLEGILVGGAIGGIVGEIAKHFVLNRSPS